MKYEILDFFDFIKAGDEVEYRNMWFKIGPAHIFIGEPVNLFPNKRFRRKTSEDSIIL